MFVDMAYNFVLYWGITAIENKIQPFRCLVTNVFQSGYHSVTNTNYSDCGV